MPDRSAFTLHTAAYGTGAVVTLGGDLDVTTAPALGRALAGLQKTPPSWLVLDMAGVEFLDCTAARVIATVTQAWPGPGVVVIRDPSPIVRRLLEVSGLAAGLRLEQAAAHLDQLAARELLTSLRSYQERPLYWVADLEALAADPTALDLLTRLATPDGK